MEPVVADAAQMRARPDCRLDARSAVDFVLGSGVRILRDGAENGAAA